MCFLLKAKYLYGPPVSLSRTVEDFRRAVPGDRRSRTAAVTSDLSPVNACSPFIDPSPSSNLSQGEREREEDDRETPSQHHATEAHQHLHRCPNAVLRLPRPLPLGLPRIPFPRHLRPLRSRGEALGRRSRPRPRSVHRSGGRVQEMGLSGGLCPVPGIARKAIGERVQWIVPSFVFSASGWPQGTGMWRAAAEPRQCAGQRVDLDPRQFGQFVSVPLWVELLVD